jgi:hypothetical protein
VIWICFFLAMRSFWWQDSLVKLHILFNNGHHKFSMWWINNENRKKIIHTYIHTFYMQISCIENTFIYSHMNKCVNRWNMNLWMNEYHMSFTFSFKFVCQIYFQCMILICEMYELWMNKFCMISISKSWDVKFGMNLFNDMISFSWWQMHSF